MNQDSTHSTAVLGRAVRDPADWDGRELGDEWLVRLTADDCASLEALAERIRPKIGDDPTRLKTLSLDDFHCEGVSEKLARVREQLKSGIGLAVLRGLHVDPDDLLKSAIQYWAIGCHIGTAIPNGARGDLMGHVTDKGETQKAFKGRGYQSRERLEFHCDQCNVVGLFCVRPSKSGGRSKISSAVRVYNDMLARHPREAALLQEPFCWSKFGEVDQGGKGYYECPVFDVIDGRFCTAFIRTHIEKGHQCEGAPPLTDERLHALQRVEDLAEERHFDMELMSGDIQFLNNSVILHSRTEFADWDEAHRRRLLWRLWLNAADIRPATTFMTTWGRGVRPESDLARIEVQ